VRGTPITRREVLAAGLLLGGAVGLPPLLGGCFDASKVQAPDSLLDVFPDPSSMRRLGRLYLARFPDEANEKRLLQTLLASFEVPPDSKHALRRHLRRSIEVDYEQGKVFRLRGWLLSRTEGRLWALAALDAG